MNSGFRQDGLAYAEAGDINKVSLNLGFYYNFTLPGYSITNLGER